MMHCQSVPTFKLVPDLGKPTALPARAPKPECLLKIPNRLLFQRRNQFHVQLVRLHASCCARLVPVTTTKPVPVTIAKPTPLPTAKLMEIITVHHVQLVPTSKLVPTPSQPTGMANSPSADGEVADQGMVV
jgi:hypothetical protein